MLPAIADVLMNLRLVVALEIGVCMLMFIDEYKAAKFV
jgi:hypothetical protein